MATIIKGRKRQGQKVSETYVVRYRDQDGRQRERTFPRRGLAVEFRATVEADRPDHRADMTLAAWCEQYISRHPGSERTRALYRSVLKNHISPAIGDVRLRALTREDIAKLLLETMPATVQRPTVDNARSLLSSALKEAVASDRIKSNPATLIRIPRASRRAEFISPSASALAALEAALPAEYRLAVWLMRGCGLRIGEALAVRADAALNGKLRITEQRLDNGRGSGPLKHRSPGDYRDVPLPEFVKARVREHIAAHGTHDGYLFAVLPNTYRRAFTRAARIAGLPASFTPHSLRHVFASVALANGVPITDVSRWLGHQSIQITYGIYGHLVPESWERARAALDAEYAAWEKNQ